jgi:hypothetical protein
MGGSWANATLTCLISRSGSFSGTLTIGKDAALVTGSGSTFSTESGSITNHGSIVNSGSLTADEIIDNGGGVIISSGKISGYYFVQVGADSTLNNTLGGAIINTSDRIIYNYGTLYNGGTIINSGYINSNSTITNTGTILNNGTINNEGGILDNHNGSITNYCGSTINNSGQITGNPVMATTSCSVVTTTVSAPEFSLGLLAVVSFATLAAVAILGRIVVRSRKSQ